MLRSGKGLGLELSEGGGGFALVAGGNAPRLMAGVSVPFAPGTLRLSRREPNVVNPELFVNRVREAHLGLSTRVNSVSVSIPDAVGRVVLLELETRFKNREEGLEIIRWKLKKGLPFDIGSVHLDYQLLDERENGAVSLLVSMVSKAVVTQYEELLIQAGLEPRFIDFTSFNLYRLFEPRLELSENCAFVTFYAGAMTMLIFFGGVLAFYRSKEAAGEPQSLYREVNSSFLVYRDKHPGQAVSEVFCMAEAADAESFRALVAEASGLEPVLLDPERMVPGQAGAALGRPAFALAGALGAAVRSL